VRSTPRWLHRSVGTLIAIWFVLVMVEPAALHACPVHGDHEMATVVADADATHAAHETPAPPEHDHAACTCPGDCTASSVGSGIPSAPAVVADARSSRARVIVRGALLRELARAPFVLPFANGPPESAGPA
jgi:hypothetical protein